MDGLRAAVVSLSAVTTLVLFSGSVGAAPIESEDSTAIDPIGLMVPTTTAKLEAVHPLSDLEPPSPDSAGIAYIEHRDNLLVTDSEVDEMRIFRDVNMFEMTRRAVLQRTGVSLPWTDEPTGVTYNPANRHIYVSADNSGATVFDVDPGADGTYGTGDDSVATLDVGDHGVRDAEGLAYDPASGHLFVVGGTREDVHEIDPGPDGLFNGVDDTTVGFFDLGGFGPSDTEGIAVNPFTGTLLVLDDPSRTVYEVTKAGFVLREIDVSAALSPRLAGIVLAPASDDSGDWNMFIVARGVDNDASRKENDGTLYEMSLDFGSDDVIPPIADSGLDQLVSDEGGDGSELVTLDASGSRDPDGSIAEYRWTIDGEEIANGENPRVALPVGTHVIELVVTDWQGLTDTDHVTVTVVSPPRPPPPPEPDTPFVCPTIAMPFTDVSASSYAFDDIACLYELGVTTGTSATTYGPGDLVTREQVASFLARVARFFGVDDRGATHPFIDVSVGSFAYGDIALLYELGVTNGVSATSFAPSSHVTREQMASLLARSYAVLFGSPSAPVPAPVVPTPFVDVSAASFAKDDIGRIYGLGISQGTSPTTFGPADHVTREQMAAFLVRLIRVLKDGAG